MTDLVVLIFENGDISRCSSLDDAKEKANSRLHVRGIITVEVTPKRGGQMTTLEFDRNSRDWVSI